MNYRFYHTQIQKWGFQVGVTFKDTDRPTGSDNLIDLEYRAIKTYIHLTLSSDSEILSHIYD